MSYKPPYARPSEAGNADAESLTGIAELLVTSDENHVRIIQSLCSR